MISVRRRVAALLEAPRPATPLLATSTRLFSRLASSRLARLLDLPPGACVVGVGGALLGGVGKTPVAAAVAKALSKRGRRVSLVAHGYKASPLCVQRVTASSGVDLVGDDALVLSQELAEFDIPVWVGPNRQETLATAARQSDVVIVDGLLQARPQRIACSLLVLDGHNPWGSGRVLPAGDLRADPEALLKTCDEIVLVFDPELEPEPKSVAEWPQALLARLSLSGFASASGRISLAQAASARVGLLLCVARPQRILSSLRARGIHPVCSWFGPDHGHPGRLDRWILERQARRHRLDAWLVTSKCRTHLSFVPGAPLWILDSCVCLDPQPWTVVDSAHAYDKTSLRIGGLGRARYATSLRLR